MVMVRCLVGGLLGSATIICRPQPVNRGPHTQDMHTNDATTINPQTWSQVPGVTPDKFGSFTFDFPFAVNLEGKLEFAKSLDQCVEGRGTQTLTIRCSRTYPYGGQRDYQYQ